MRTRRLRVWVLGVIGVVAAAGAGGAWLVIGQQATTTTTVAAAPTITTTTVLPTTTVTTTVPPTITTTTVPPTTTTQRMASDLVVDLPTASDSNPTAGQAITLEVTVRNQGAGESSPTTLRYYRSTDSTVTLEDTQVGSVPVPGLNASASTRGESIVTVALSVPGTFYFGACVVPVHLESDTTNNCSNTVAVTAEPGFTLSGTVRDGRRNGQLIAGARVRLENGRSQSTITDQSGQYQFTNVSGTVRLSAAASFYYISETVEVAVHADHTADFTLKIQGIVPYSGTVYITPDLIGPADPTSLQSVTYIGRGVRDIYDRRPAAWITVNAYLFRVTYETVELEFQVNPEFGSREAARQEVDTYAPVLGRLPAVLLSRAREVHINAGHELAGGNPWDGSFLIHTGYAQTEGRFLEEVFIHEAGHVSLDGDHASSVEWRAAQTADGVFISTYARDFPHREDIAESILAYFAVRYFPERLSESDRAVILATIPNRLAYFDEQGFDMSPYAMPESDSTTSER